jgi:glutathione peroxidase
MMTAIYDFDVANAAGNNIQLADYRGKVVLIVNTASQCGFTPQLEGLEELYGDYREQGLEILGFPCNQFGRQDPGSNDEIQQFCQLNYGVSFPVLAKIDVNGANSHPLFSYLKNEAPGLAGSTAIKWNFTKFLIGRDGHVIKRFAPLTPPAKIRNAIEAALANN